MKSSLAYRFCKSLCKSLMVSDLYPLLPNKPIDGSVGIEAITLSQTANDEIKFRIVMKSAYPQQKYIRNHQIPKIQSLMRLKLIQLYIKKLKRSCNIIQRYMKMYIKKKAILEETAKKKRKKKKKKKDVTKEGFGEPISYEDHKQKFEEPSKNNPLQNVLPLDIEKNPKRNPAAPAYHPQVEEKINKAAEKIGFDKKLFSDLGDNISFQNSMRNFYSMPNTRVPNAQKSFALFCYGDMKSCKEGDKVQCVKNSNRYTNF